MTIFILSIATVLIVSAICSLSEAAIYAVRLPYVRQIAESGSRPGRILAEFKENMERPISAILIVNTVANTAGAAIAGGQARLLFGDAALVWFSIAFTIAVLFLSEIVPKVAGVIHNRRIATALALPWAAAIRVLFPLIWLSQLVSRVLKPSESAIAPEEEVHHFARMSAEEGSIMPHEAEMVGNVLRLDELTTRDLMTPRPVVFKVAADLTLAEASKQIDQWAHTRIPVYDAADPESWVGMVFIRDVLAALCSDRFELTIGELAKPLRFVAEETEGHVLLRSFLKQRTHLFGVVDRYGDITGIVTLEDVLESVLGEEIVDEVDVAVDMQALARRRKKQRFKEMDDDGMLSRGEDDDG